MTIQLYVGGSSWEIGGSESGDVFLRLPGLIGGLLIPVKKGMDTVFSDTLGEVIPVELLPGKVVQREVLTGDVIPGDVIPGDVRPGDVRPGDELPGDRMPGDES